jgi:hypothetical protein
MPCTQFLKKLEICLEDSSFSDLMSKHFTKIYKKYHLYNFIFYLQKPVLLGDSG